MLGDKEADRTFGNVGVSLALALQGVQVLRVHDVGPTRQALDLFLQPLNLFDIGQVGVGDDHRICPGDLRVGIGKAS